MEIIVGKLGGFCFGVKNAIDSALKEVNDDKIYCLGEIVHNEKVIQMLENKGMITVDSIDEIPNNSNVIFRSHGEAKEIYEEANLKNLKIIDLTCPKVKAIHIKVEREKEKSFIIIVGKKNHPEIIGTKSFAGKNSFVIENDDEILDCYMEYEKTNLGKVYIVSQTTFSSLKFDRLVEELELNFYEADVIVDKTICDSTENRQKETREISKKVNKMIIIGGKHSSNTKELAKVAEENCGKVYLVQESKDLKSIEFTNNDKIGIMAGASTPKESIDEIVNFLNQI
jgi:4-hydroxy-3-methylbut-2-enyl diphosphate reductase